jgi:DNA repair protein RadC
MATATLLEHPTMVMPRERALTEGFDQLSDTDLIAVLLGTGSQGVPVALAAADLLSNVGGVGGLASFGAHSLADLPGVGVAKACRLLGGIELGRRVMAAAGVARDAMPSSRAVARWASARLGHLDHEQIWVLALDGRNGLRAARRVAEGGLHGCSITARDVLRPVIREAASAFVIVHNHPSGDPTPSPEDIELTEAIARAGAIVGTPLVDHVIVAGTKHASLFDLGVIGGSDSGGR